MKKQIIIFLLSFFPIGIYGKSVTIKHTVGNTTIYVSCFSYREEINKGIIIGEYVKELSKKYNYSDSIEIFLEMIPNEHPEYSFRNKKNIFLHVNASKFNVFENLKLIEFAILKKGRINKKVNYNEILRSSNSDQINEVLMLPIERPDIIKELVNKSEYSYRFQNEKYHIYNIETKESLLSVNSIYLFKTIAYSRPLIFINNHEFYYKSLNGDLKRISFSGENELSEDFSMKEFNYFVLFNVVEKGNDNIAILNLEKDKLIDKLEW
ncbi:hypothetical protein CLU96_2473 [Chryseobacterium sp. 52]|uniref:hypothetical protein n=1 Tax=Chryseobacterium sp. 52 TaxID=2035213 RepID=UPI000C1A07DB|nr:hypothetical protein [Chryseobacterium sp. 52]PIF45468.1 hypothetical protein CLU96_2473 [Chryseobacterium sp. 52]